MKFCISLSLVIISTRLVGWLAS